MKEKDIPEEQMTLPEYELTGHCHHGHEVDTCTTDKCKRLLSGL